MKVEIINCLQDNFSYILIDEEKNACVIDPSEKDPIINYIDKNNLKLKFILNTHHHFDHVGGNKDLKNKYGCKVVGFEKDKERIPEIDICLKDKEIWSYKSFEAEIFHIPGHTLGHICYFFRKEKILFTGDTLFSLGCGRIFEGTYQEMYDSLNIIKSFPRDTKIFFGHEYTLNNAKFCVSNDKDNINLKRMIDEINLKLKNGEPTSPTTLDKEMHCNIFLKAKDLQTFKKLRDLKDNF